MAEKTEQATPKRRQEAQQRGQVPRSPELTSAAALLALVLALTGGGAALGGRLADYGADLLRHGSSGDLDAGGVQALATQAVLTILAVVLPMAGAAAGAGVLASWLQGGLVFSLRPLAPDFSRISPAQGFARLFSRKAALEGGKALLKLALVGWVAYATLQGRSQILLAAAGQRPQAFVALLADAAGSLLLRCALALAGIAVLDYWVQRRRFEQELRMTKQELKEEMRQTEGNPEVRGRVKRRQRELIRRRMLHQVKKASVVVTNPTHFAVALLYVAGMPAPRVVAKGQDYLALRIRELAAQHGVPLVENPPLARSLYASVDLGESVPAELFQAVAEVLAFVYRLRGYIPGSV